MYRIEVKGEKSEERRERRDRYSREPKCHLTSLLTSVI